MYHAAARRRPDTVPFAYIMKKTHIIFLAVVVLAAAAYYFWLRTAGGDVAVDLVALSTNEALAEFRPGEKKDLLFKAAPETVKGESKPAIFMHAASRLTFKDVEVPDNGRLRAWIAVKEEAWSQDASDGVLFRFGVDDGRYEELLNQHVDPRHNANDRGWLPVDIDLSAYAGQKVKLIFNTNTSLPGRGDNGAYDFSIWGAPAIVTRP
jgi:hypothetical protein